ncbi:hypothetical protein A2997_00085 [Candidatus Nomurabacteria bacterium RIFCSPLOWO2_01_FULL_36_10b]|uniref:Uncharacterized protein n=1 Tax=Candidatus Nomurabacteria bacterium RIFCSPLOWO2_01_FULL_36_10b TaxID=1801766 RepID=A0A1F6WQE0_9BACT|nr:MAG: hypothetical protein A2997_00085 [Candidatus Nomurabacteria bacterium RIFCSPLOWO2_01_FULL_36_10b]
MSLLPQQTQKLIDERIAHMPLAFQDVINNFDWQTEIQTIGAKHRLTGDQSIKLIVETAMVMTLIENPAMFRNNIENNIGIAPIVAKAIADDLKVRVFDRMQSDLLSSNKGHITHLQNEINKLEREMAQENISEDENIESIDKVHVVDSIDLSGVKQQESSKYKGSDPYHEVVE